MIQELFGQTLSAQRDEPAPVVARKYRDADDGTTDAAEAITLDRGARDLTALRNNEEDASGDENAARFRDELDRLRGDHIPSKDADDPEGDLAKPDSKASPAKEKPAAEATADGVDPKLEEALKHPRVVQAIEQRVGAA